MAKLPVLTIGYNRFVLPAKTNVNAILSALQDAQAVDYTYEGTRKVFFPEESAHRSHIEIGMEYVDQSQFVAANPNRKAFEKPAAPTARAITSGQLALPEIRHATQP